MLLFKTALIRLAPARGKNTRSKSELCLPAILPTKVSCWKEENLWVDTFIAQGFCAVKTVNQWLPQRKETRWKCMKVLSKILDKPACFVESQCNLQLYGIYWGNPVMSLGCLFDIHTYEVLRCPMTWDPFISSHRNLNKWKKGFFPWYLHVAWPTQSCSSDKCHKQLPAACSEPEVLCTHWDQQQSTVSVEVALHMLISHARHATVLPSAIPPKDVPYNQSTDEPTHGGSGPKRLVMWKMHFRPLITAKNNHFLCY